jgi:hypothetical protein
LAVAILKILSGEIQKKGIMDAESAFEPQSFFDELGKVLPEPPPNGTAVADSFEWLD